MKKVLFSVIAMMTAIFTLTSCNSDNDPYSVNPSCTGIYSGFNASTGDSTTVIISPIGSYDHISVKSASKETVIDMSTMMTINSSGTVAFISDQGLGGYEGKITFSNNGKTATLELTNAQGYEFKATLAKTTFPTSIAGTWFNGSTGAQMTVNLYPAGVCDKGTIKFSASDKEHAIVIGAINSYGKGLMQIDKDAAKFALGTSGEKTTITVTYNNTDYTFTFVGKKD